MQDDDQNPSGIDRRSLLRRASVGVGAVFGVNGIGAAASREEHTWTIQADVSGIDGLKNASITLQNNMDRATVIHHYEYTNPAFGTNRSLSGASLELDVSDIESVPTTQSEADALQVIATEQSIHSSPGADSGSSADTTAFAETNSPLCGTLAETDIPVSVDHFSGIFTGADIEVWANDDVDCPWYVPGFFETTWKHVSDTLDWDSDYVDAEAEYLNNDFPDRGSVTSTHSFDFDETPSSTWEMDIENESTGAPSEYLLGLRSSTGTR